MEPPPSPFPPFHTYLPDPSRVVPRYASPCTSPSHHAALVVGSTRSLLSKRFLCTFRGLVSWSTSLYCSLGRYGGGGGVVYVLAVAPPSAGSQRQAGRKENLTWAGQVCWKRLAAGGAGRAGSWMVMYVQREDLRDRSRCRKKSRLKWVITSTRDVR